MNQNNLVTVAIVVMAVAIFYLINNKIVTNPPVVPSPEVAEATEDTTESVTNLTDEQQKIRLQLDNLTKSVSQVVKVQSQIVNAINQMRQPPKPPTTATKTLPPSPPPQPAPDPAPADEPAEE